MNKDSSTEEKIKEAARKVFTQKGYAATRTRDIAEASGVNLALLNYYFKSKENLFDIIMLENIREFSHSVLAILNNKETSFYQKIELLAAHYIDKLIQNPEIPIFLLAELKEVVSQVEASNDPAFGTTGAKLREALGSLERSSKWLLERMSAAPNDALAGATPYLRLFGSTLGGCMLAGEALVAKGNGEAEPQRHVALARFFAENVAVAAGSLEKTVTDSAEAVNGADAALMT